MSTVAAVSLNLDVDVLLPRLMLLTVELTTVF